MALLHHQDFFSRRAPQPPAEGSPGTAGSRSTMAPNSIIMPSRELSARTRSSIDISPPFLDHSLMFLDTKFQLSKQISSMLIRRLIRTRYTPIDGLTILCTRCGLEQTILELEPFWLTTRLRGQISRPILNAFTNPLTKFTIPVDVISFLWTQL